MKTIFAAKKPTRKLLKTIRTQLTIFDQQDGKIVRGTVIQTTDFWFALKCTDGQTRKFDINCLPLA